MVVQFLCCKINTKKHENFWSVFLHANNVGSEKLLKYRVGEIIGFAPLLSRLVTECSNFSTCILMTLAQWVEIFSQGAFTFLFYQKIFQGISSFGNRCSLFLNFWWTPTVYSRVRNKSTQPLCLLNFGGGFQGLQSW